MKKNLKTIVLLFVTFLVASLIGQTVANVVFPRKTQTNHICTCERCKLTRQLETIEVVDSVIHERIVININKED